MIQERNDWVETFKRVHFVGIGGYGMSALAKIMLQMNYMVTGSDLNESQITRKLEDIGVKIDYFHGPDNIKGADLVVYSTAIPSTNSEIMAAREKGIPLWHRSELLAYLINSKYGIAVAGTHGKTTTTSMLSLVMEKAGLDPTAVIGGELTDFDGNARLGKSHYLVAEACESDHSFLRYKPAVAIVTNVEADHLEHYGGSFKKIKETYEKFLLNIKEGGMAIICADDPHLKTMREKYDLECITYGIKKAADFLAAEIYYKDGGSAFNVYFKGVNMGRVELNVPGEHNVYNALAAIAVARLLGVNFQRVAEILKEFKGAKRRFQIVYEGEGITIVDDYAHHPTEIRATLAAARSWGKRRVIAVFQPHRYSRTYYLFNNFVRSFGEANVVVISPIYSAGEKPMGGVSSDLLVERIREEEDRDVILLDSIEEIEKYLFRIVRPGDMIITMGAGDIWRVAYTLAGKLEKVHSESR